MAASPDCFGFPLSCSRTRALAGRKSSSAIGLKLIQNIAISGRTITSATDKIVGSKSAQANLASRLESGPRVLGAAFCI